MNGAPQRRGDGRGRGGEQRKVLPIIPYGRIPITFRRKSLFFNVPASFIDSFWTLSQNKCNAWNTLVIKCDLYMINQRKKKNNYLQKKNAIQNINAWFKEHITQCTLNNTSQPNFPVRRLRSIKVCTSIE